MDTRDPERIAPMLDLLGALWREHPDWRLGQLLGNVVDTQDVDHVMLSHVKDDVIAAGLLAMTSERRRIGGELARALGIDAANLPQASEFPTPRYRTPDAS